MDTEVCQTLQSLEKIIRTIIIIFFIFLYTIGYRPMSLTKLYQKFETLCEENKLRNFCLAEIKVIIDDEIKEIMEKKKTMTGVLPFGKYKSKKIEDIAKLDKDYLRWIMNQPWFDKFTDLKAEVQKYL